METFGSAIHESKEQCTYVRQQKPSPEPVVPRVSVLVTTFNGGKFVLETIDSLLDQTFDDFELIIVDDASTDSTFDLLTAYNDPRIRLFRNIENLGISRTRNRALAHARGEYVAANDQDDISTPDRLEKEVAFLDQNPRVGLVAAAAAELRGAKRRSLYKPEMRPHVLAWRLFTRCSIVHSTICFRRSLAESENIRYEPEYHFAEDFVLFHRFSKAGDIVVLPDELVTYREHEASASSSHSDVMNENGMLFLRQAYEVELGLSISRDENRLLWRTFMLWSPAETEGDLVTAGGLYAKALGAFLARRTLAEGERGDILRFGAEDWWRAVSAYCRKEGRISGLDLYRRIGDLSSKNPRLSSVMITGIRAAMRRLTI